MSLIFSIESYSGFSFLSPPRATTFSSLSRAFIRFSSSLRRSSSEMISRSRTGSTSPSTCVTSGSSKARHRWKMLSQALMCERKSLPRPCPSAAPLTRPAMSTTLRYAGTTLQGERERENEYEDWRLLTLRFGTQCTRLTWLACGTPRGSRNARRAQARDVRVRQPKSKCERAGQRMSGKERDRQREGEKEREMHVSLEL